MERVERVTRTFKANWGKKPNCSRLLKFLFLYSFRSLLLVVLRSFWCISFSGWWCWGKHSSFHPLSVSPHVRCVWMVKRLYFWFFLPFISLSLLIFLSSCRLFHLFCCVKLTYRSFVKPLLETVVISSSPDSWYLGWRDDDFHFIHSFISRFCETRMNEGSTGPKEHKKKGKNKLQTSCQKEKPRNVG